MRELIVKGFLGLILAIVTLGLYSVADYLWPLWDKNNQTLHDKMGKTVVVQTRPVLPRPPP